MAQPSVQFMPFGLHRTLNLQHVLETWIRLWLKTSAAYQQPLCFFLHSVVHFHLLGKSKPQSSSRDGRQRLTLPWCWSWPSQPLLDTGYLSYFPKLHLVIYNIAQKEKRLNIILHSHPSIYLERKNSVHLNMWRELWNIQRVTKHWRHAEPSKGGRCSSLYALPAHAWRHMLALHAGCSFPLSALIKHSRRHFVKERSKLYLEKSEKDKVQRWTFLVVSFLSWEVNVWIAE